MSELKELSFEEAKARAERMAFEHMGGFWPGDSTPFLDEFFIRGKNFWMFFAHKGVEFPVEAWFQKEFSAYAVSDYGSVRYIRDLRGQPEKLQDALDGLPIGFAKDRVIKQKEQDEAERGPEITSE